MKVGKHARVLRLVGLASLCVLLLAHSPFASAQSPGEARTDQQGRQVRAPTCPSQDFVTFLRRYADVDDDSVRNRFTEDPLEYEVPTHRVEEEAPSSAPTHTSLRYGPPRLGLFPYRYLKEERMFDHIDRRDGQDEQKTVAPYPVAISPVAEDGREVSFGSEYEVDTYVFKRSRGCWYLSRVIDLRD